VRPSLEVAESFSCPVQTSNTPLTGSPSSKATARPGNETCVADLGRHSSQLIRRQRIGWIATFSQLLAGRAPGFDDEVVRASGTEPGQLPPFSAGYRPAFLASVEAMQTPAPEVHRFGLALQVGVSHSALLLRGSVSMSVNLLTQWRWPGAFRESSLPQPPVDCDGL